MSRVDGRRRVEHCTAACSVYARCSRVGAWAVLVIGNAARVCAARGVLGDGRPMTCNAVTVKVKLATRNT
eukprot:scaffold4787_cov117-Isochrysis_galbana.AAC.3